MFRDRQDAGNQLAAMLLHFKDQHPQPVVVGLPRGGVVVAAQIARALDAPLDVQVVRKLGAPQQPELAIGAVADGEHPAYVLNDDLIEALGIDESYLQAEIERELQEVQRREARFRQGRDAAPVTGQTVIVVDDGIATGATVRAALIALRQRQPAWLILAVPVAPPEALRALQDQVDQIVCPLTPSDFLAVGRFYADFEQVTDEQVIALLDEAAARQLRRQEA